MESRLKSDGTNIICALSVHPSAAKIITHSTQRVVLRQNGGGINTPRYDWQVGEPIFISLFFN